jgi:hypothetical protein
MTPQYAHRTDANQQEIMDALRKASCAVWDTSMVGRGFPDLVCGFFDVLVPHIVLMECKVANGKLTPDEEAFKKKWLPFFGHVYFIVRSPEQALKVIGKA